MATRGIAVDRSLPARRRAGSNDAAGGTRSRRFGVSPQTRTERARRVVSVAVSGTRRRARAAAGAGRRGVRVSLAARDAWQSRSTAQRFPELPTELPPRLASIARGAAAERRKSASSHPPSVPGYEILAEIGRGGMGVVYHARETQLGRPVALKFLPPEVAHDNVLLDRFRREAQTASSLNHPHICTVHALGEHAGRPFIVLEFIEGQTLKALASQRWEPHELARVLRQAAGALQAAHTAGVVHRDIKPENIMLRRDGYVKVLDFGLARRLPTLAASGGEAAQETWPGAILGTVAYMSPEQARGEPLAASSDIFSLGIVLYQLLTGVHPFDRGTPLATLQAIASAEPLPPSRLSTNSPPSLDGLAAAMLHKDPRLRPAASEVASALSPIVFGQHLPRTRTDQKIVHREVELAALRRTWAATQAGRGHVVCVAGEPGIGKTTLVDDFLAELGSANQCFIARGRCSERHAQVAAYLPVIDALADLMRGESRDSTTRMAQVVAPTWFAQLAVPVRHSARPTARHGGRPPRGSARSRPGTRLFAAGDAPRVCEPAHRGVASAPGGAVYRRRPLGRSFDGRSAVVLRAALPAIAGADHCHVSADRSAAGAASVPSRQTGTAWPRLGDRSCAQLSRPRADWPVSRPGLSGTRLSGGLCRLHPLRGPRGVRCSWSICCDT